MFLSVLDTGRFLLQQVLLAVLSRDSLSFAETTRCAGIKLGNKPSQIETGVLCPGPQLYPVDGAVSLSGWRNCPIDDISTNFLHFLFSCCI